MGDGQKSLIPADEKVIHRLRKTSKTVIYTENIRFSYQRYLTNKLREYFKPDLCPINIIFRKREKTA